MLTKPRILSKTALQRLSLLPSSPLPTLYLRTRITNEYHHTSCLFGRFHHCTMGFTTGLLGGATLTYSILYLTLYVHRANRNAQHALLSQSHILLNSAVEPLPPTPESPAYEVRKTSLTEELKDRWNGEIEHAVRRLQTTDWDAVRQRWERRIGNVFQRLRESDAGREVAAAGDRLTDHVAATGDKLNNSIVGATEGAKDAAKSAKDTTKQNTTGKRLLEQ